MNDIPNTEADMFGKENPAAVDDGPDTGRGIGLAYCAGAQAFAVVGRKLRVMASGGVGLTVQHETLPLPSGRVVALGAGLSVVTADGTLWWWHPMGKEWQKVGNLLDDSER